MPQTPATPTPHSFITLLPVCGQLAYLLLAIFIFVLEAMSGPNVIPFFLGLLFLLLVSATVTAGCV